MIQTSISAWLKKSNDGKERSSPARDEVSLQSLSRDRECTVAAGHDTPAEKNTLVLDGDHPNGAKNVSSTSLLQRHRRLPSNARIAAITAETLPAFRSMTALLLPVPYPDKFYNEILRDEIASRISLVCLWSELSPSHDESDVSMRVVSGIRCLLLANSPALSALHEKSVPANASPSLYISTITTLAPYRGHGLASALLRQLIARAIRDYAITTVTAHMWEGNEDAKEWYSNLGFKEIGFQEHYYRRLRPRGAWLLERKVGPHDLLDEYGPVEMNCG